MAEQKTISMDYKDPNDSSRDLTIYATDGKPRTAQQFDAAMSRAKLTGKLPEGFVDVKPGSIQALVRGGFETVNQPAQMAAQAIDLGAPGLRTLAPGLADVADTVRQKVLGLPPGIRTAPSGEATGPVGMAAETVNTLPKAGMTLGTLATAPLMAPVSLTGATGSIAMQKLPMLLNMAKAGVGGAVGGAMGRAAGGEDVTPANVAIDAGIAALSGGVQGVVDHFLTKFISPNKVEKVAGGILKEIVNEYPVLKNQPGMLDIYTKSPEKLQALSSRLASSLREETDTLALDMTRSITSAVNATSGVPRNLSAGQQNAIRAKANSLVNAHNEFLNVMGNGEKEIAAREVVDRTQQELVNAVAKELGSLKMKNPSQALQAVDGILTQGFKDLQKFSQGAKVLQALKDAGTPEGFNAAKFNDIIAGRYQEQPGSLLHKVGQQLGMGAGLTKGADIPAEGGAGLFKDLLMTGARHIPAIGRFIPSPKAPAPTTLPWQTMPAQGVIGRAATMGAAIPPARTATENAIKSFLGE